MQERTVRAVLFLCPALLKKNDFCVRIKEAKYMHMGIYTYKGVKK